MPVSHQPETWVGGIVVLLQAPIAGGGVDIDVPEESHDDFIDALLERAKEVDGPLINGIWAITFEVGPTIDPSKLVAFARGTWMKYAQKVIR